MTRIGFYKYIYVFQTAEASATGLAPASVKVGSVSLQMRPVMSNETHLENSPALEASLSRIFEAVGLAGRCKALSWLRERGHGSGSCCMVPPIWTSA
eukprot:s657_g16.t1